jgi:hypothetical protein
MNLIDNFKNPITINNLTLTEYTCKDIKTKPSEIKGKHAKYSV